MEDVKKSAQEHMRNSITHLQEEFSAIRSGRASASMVDRLNVEYYGSTVPLVQLASFSVPEARQLLISPFDKGAIASIEKAIQVSDLGVNPSNDGSNIRLVFPPLTEERRKELVKVAKAKAEEAKVSARNARRNARQDLEKLEKDGEISKDDVERAEKDLDKVTSDIVAEIDSMSASKEAELMEV
ncbi:MAG: ribosome recycling factor [Acidimicrobiia bacterium]